MVHAAHCVRAWCWPCQVVCAPKLLAFTSLKVLCSKLGGCLLAKCGSFSFIVAPLPSLHVLGFETHGWHLELIFLEFFHEEPEIALEEGRAEFFLPLFLGLELCSALKEGRAVKP